MKGLGVFRIGLEVVAVQERLGLDVHPVHVGHDVGVACSEIFQATGDGCLTREL